MCIRDRSLSTKLVQSSVMVGKLDSLYGGSSSKPRPMTEQKKTSLICLTNTNTNNEKDKNDNMGKGEVIDERSDEDENEGVIEESDDDGKIPDSDDEGSKAVNFHSQLQSMVKMAQSKIL
eukprot:TRINITY_DN9594_c0_g1_i13.p2 TRINITY_DN9594_c0_g1~~TRINITY_DN9594_c0_g1_i13.p2  ORF type:complete len:120 (-),score=36.68 TRINITY_DN9594_c0_g1_i13:183-542(-)